MRLHAKAIIIGALALASAFGAAGPAVAGPAVATPAAAPSDVAPLAFSDCPASRVCLWNLTNGGGSRVEVNNPTCAGVNLGALVPPLNDMADSLRNRESSTVYFYSYAGNGNWNWIATLSSGQQLNLISSRRNRIDLVSTCTH